MCYCSWVVFGWGGGLGFGSGCVAFLLGWCGWCLWCGDFYSQVFLRLRYCWVVMGVAIFWGVGSYIDVFLQIRV